MTIINIENVSKAFADKIILQNASYGIEENKAKLGKAEAQTKAAADEFKVAEKQVSAFGDIDFISIYDADTKKK